MKRCNDDSDTTMLGFVLFHYTSLNKTCITSAVLNATIGFFYQ